MKLLIGATVMLGAALMMVRMAARFGMSQEQAMLIVYLVAAVWILALLVTLVRWIIQKRRAAAANAAPVDPAILAQRARLKELRAVLAQARGHQRRTAIPRPWLTTKFESPWLALVGQPGHGKTTLLGPTSATRLVEVDRDGVRNTPPESPPDDRPRVFSAPSSAVYLEVPHALARTDAMRPAWLAVLKQLKKRSQPLHGIIVVVAADELATGDPTRAAQLGDDLSRELIDLEQQLAIRVPVYLNITKIDRIVGFHDLLGDAEPRGQALGFELPDGRSEELLLKELRTRYDALCTALDRRALRAVSRFPEPDHAVQPRLFTFPRQLAELTDDLAALTKALVTPRAGAEAPRLRGVYLTSTTQGGDPAIAPILDNLLRAAGGGSYTPDKDRPAQTRRYFLDELMTTVWQRGARLATLTPGARTRMTVVRATLSAIGLLLAAHVGFTGTTVAESNRKLAQDTVDVSNRLVTQLGGERRVPLGTADLEVLGAVLSSWEDKDGVDAAQVRGWTLFAGDTVVPPLQKFFRHAVFRGVLEPLHKRTAAELQDFLASYESPDRLPELTEWLGGHDALRFYLLLSGPKADGEKLPIRDDRRVLIAGIRDRWNSAARAAVGPREHSVMEALAVQYVDLAQDADFNLPREPALIETIREILLRDVPENAEVDEVIDRVSSKPDIPKISLRQLAGVPSVENDNTDIRGAFTEVGWSYVKSEFATLERGDPWVLGLGDERAREIKAKRGRNLRSIYFDAYVKEWKRFISRTRIVSPTNLDRAKDIYGEVMRGPKRPLAKVFLKLQDNVTLKDDFDYGDTGLALFTDKKKVSGSVVRAGDVAKSFSRILEFTVAPPGKEAEVALDQYHTHMRTLHDGVVKALENKDEEKALVDALKAAIDDTESLISNGSLEEWEKDTTELLVTPLKDLLKILERESGEGAKGDWCARIVEPMYDRFAGRYPLDPESRDEVALADFEEFFHPENGEIRKAREALLSGWVTKSGNYYEARDLGKGDVSRIDPEVIKFLNRAADISMVMFVSEELRVDFDVVLVCNPQVSRVEFKVAGELREFTCDSKQLPRLRWPSKAGQGASLMVRGRQTKKNLDEQGEWGLFKLLEKWSKLPDGTGDVLDFIFDLTQYDLGSLEVRLKPIRNRSGTAFFGLSNGDRKFLSLVRASNVLPPKRLFTNRGGCN